jgi:hypothetical protein
MQTRSLLIFCALTVIGCGGGNKETLEKKVKGLQDEVTRLQNSQDRVAERLQAIEIQAMREKPSASATAPAKDEPATVSRPPLKIVKLAPGPAGGGEPVADVVEPQPDDDATSTRPVLRDYGAKAPPAWQKAAGKPAGTSTRAAAPRVGQNDPGAAPVTPSAPQGK